MRNAAARAFGTRSFLWGTAFVVGAWMFAGVPQAQADASAGATPPPIDAPACAPVSSGWISWWRGEDAPRDSVGRNHGVLEGTTTFGSGLVGRAFRLHGLEGDGIFLGDSSDFDSTFDQGFSAEAWVRLDSPSVTSSVILQLGFSCSAGMIVFGVVPDGVAAAVLYDANGGPLALAEGYAGSEVEIGAWTHIAMVREVEGPGNRLLLYQNGEVVASVNDPSDATFAKVADDYIGRTPSCANRQPNTWDGLIDELAVYARPLSASEVESIYQAGAAGKRRLIFGDGFEDGAAGSWEVGGSAQRLAHSPRRASTGWMAVARREGR